MVAEIHGSDPTLHGLGKGAHNNFPFRGESRECHAFP